MNFKTLITILPILAASLFPMSSHAGATAFAQVSANIIPVVAASVSGEVIMNDISTEANTANRSVSLTSSSAAKFNMKNDAAYAYDVSVSSTVNVADKSGNKMTVDNFRMPASHDVASKGEQTLHMQGDVVIADQQKTGAYAGSVYITANFN